MSYAIDHSFPLLVSLQNIILTDMVFLKKDAYITFWCGVLYTPFNWILATLAHQAIYPVGDWVDTKFTICVYISGASFMAICHYLAAVVTQKISGYKEDPY